MKVASQAPAPLLTPDCALLLPATALVAPTQMVTELLAAQKEASQMTLTAARAV